MRNLFLILLTPLLVFGLNDSDKALFGTQLNYLRNPGFESGRAGWTASGGTYSAVTLASSVQFGKASVTWDSSAAAQTLTSLDQVTLDANNGLKGQNGLLSCYIKAASGTATHTLGLFVGTTRFESTIISSVDGARTNVYFPITTAGSTTINTISITSVAANEPLITIDDCYLGLTTAVNVGSITDWRAYTPTFTGFGTTTNVFGFWRQVGDKMEVRFTVSTGTVDGTLASISLPAGFPINTTKLRITNNTTASTGDLVGFTGTTQGNANVQNNLLTAPATSTTLVYFSQQDGASTNKLSPAAGNVVATSTTALMGEFSVPIQGWSASQSAAAADQTDFGWRNAGAVTITGSTTNPTKGTVTIDELWYKRTGPNLEILYNYKQSTGGANGSGDYIYTLPTVIGCTIDTTVTRTNTVIGSNSGTDNANVGSVSVGITAVAAGSGTLSIYSTTQFRLIPYVTSPASTVQSVGSTVFALGNANVVYTAKGSFPCSNWVENQRAPTLIGSVTSNSVGALRTEYANLAAIGTVTNESSDWINGNCTNATPNVCTFVSGVFSSQPVCHIIRATTGFTDVPGIAAISSTSVSYSFHRHSVGELQAASYITCIGPR